MPVIIFDQVWHAYSGGTPFETVSLCGLNLEVIEGDLVGLVGLPGSGKSTVLKHLNGLLQPDRGRVLVDGADTRDKKVRKNLWMKVGLVFQYPEKQFFEETVYREVSFGPRNLGLAEPEIDRRVTEALAMVGLDRPGMQQLSPFRLSGGEQRRVALASVLALKPRILALDEPTAGIDPASRKKFFQGLKKLRDDHGITVVMASHNMDDVAALADRVVVLNKGQAVLAGPAGKVFADFAAIRGAGLELPFPCEVIDRLNESGFGIEGAPLTTEAAAEEIYDRLRDKNYGSGDGRTF